MDVAAMDRLPDTSGLKDEVVVQRGHRNAYDHAIRAVGVRMVEGGYLGDPGAGGAGPGGGARGRPPGACTATPTATPSAPSECAWWRLAIWGIPALGARVRGKSPRRSP